MYTPPISNENRVNGNDRRMMESDNSVNSNSTDVVNVKNEYYINIT